MHIDSEFEGGNIRIIAMEENAAHLDVELRDTQTDWFYWAFHVTGAAGRTMRFDFSGKQRVGYYGAAASRDLENWVWTGDAFPDFTGFTYAFGPEEDSVYFCHDMRYATARFRRLCDELRLPIQTLAVSERGRAIPYVEFGSGENVLLITSRHHACESTGTYVLEGVLRSLARAGIPGFTVIAVPFVDLDGVVDGDQGKNRRPHDHNRDYAGEPIYASIRAIRKIAAERPVVFAFDLHSPWHFGGRHDVGHGVRKNPAMDAAQSHFGELLTRACRANPAAFQYDTRNDLGIGEEWNTNTNDPAASFSTFFAAHPGTEFALSLETPYFGTPDNVVSQNRLLALGDCAAEALCKLAAERG